MNNLITLKNISLIPEFFLGLSLIYLLIFGSIISTHKTRPLIQDLILKLSVLILILSLFLVFNDKLWVIENLTFNNTIIYDYLSFFSKITILVFSLISILMIRFYIKDQKLNQFEYTIIILLAVLGFLLLCSANDLITAYLAIELQSLAFYVMASFKKKSSFSVEAGLKYFVLGSFSSALFLFGSSLIYGVTGTLNFEDFKDLFLNDRPKEDLADSIEFLFGSSLIYGVTGALNLEDFKDLFLNDRPKEYLADSIEFIPFESDLVQIASLFIIVSLFFKLAVAPIHAWSPDVYEGSPTSSTIFFAVVSKLSILVLLTRIFQYSFHGFIYNWRYYIVVIAVLSVIVGSFTALEQKKLKSLLAYSSVSHIGYILIAFSTGTFEGIQSMFAYILIYMLAGSCVWSIFLILRLKSFHFKKQNKDLTDISLLVKSNNIIAICFSIVLLSIAGFPPLVGFFTKMSIFLSALESSMYLVSVISILASVISTFYYIRIIKIIYFENLLVGRLYYPLRFIETIIVITLFFSFIFLFINPTLLYLISYKLSLLGFF